MATRTQQYITAIRALTWTVPSATTAGAEYTVSASAWDAPLRCTCPARRLCWHVKAVHAGLAGKPRAHVTVRPASIR